MDVGWNCKMVEFWTDIEHPERLESTGWSTNLIYRLQDIVQKLYALDYMKTTIKQNGYYSIFDCKEELEYLNSNVVEHDLKFTDHPPWSNDHGAVLLDHLSNTFNSDKLDETVALPGIRSLFFT